MDYNQIISQGMVAIGVLVALTNIITEVAKLNFTKFFDQKDKINVFCTIIAIVLTLISGFAYAEINSIHMVWYHFVALIIIGFMVALASMTNFDKLLSYFENIKGDK